VNDDEIRKLWIQATRLYQRGCRLCVLIAYSICDDMEAQGVTEADIDRVFGR